MPPDIGSIDSDISKCVFRLPKKKVMYVNLTTFFFSFALDKISALTPFSDQFMPSVGGPPMQT